MQCKVCFIESPRELCSVRCVKAARVAALLHPLRTNDVVIVPRSSPVFSVCARLGLEEQYSSHCDTLHLPPLLADGIGAALALQHIGPQTKKRPYEEEEVAKQLMQGVITDVPDLVLAHAAVYLPYDSLRRLRVTNRAFYRLVESENLMFNFTDMRYLIFRTVHAILSEDAVMFYQCQRALCSTLPNLLHEIIDRFVAFSIYVPNSNVELLEMSQLVLTAMQNSREAFTTALQLQTAKHAARLAASPGASLQIQCLWTMGLDVTAITDDVMVVLGATGDWLQRMTVDVCLQYAAIRELALNALVWLYSPMGAKFKLNHFWPSTLWLYPPLGRTLNPGNTIKQTRDFFSLQTHNLLDSEVNSFYPDTLNRLLDFFLQLDMPELTGAFVSINGNFHPLVSEYTFLAAEKIIELFAAAGQLDELLDRLASLHLGFALPFWLEATHSFFSKPQVCEFSGIKSVGEQTDLFRAAAFSAPSPPPLVSGLAGGLLNSVKVITLLRRVYKLKEAYGQADVIRALVKKRHGLTVGQVVSLLDALTTYNEQRVFTSWISSRTYPNMPLSAWLLALRYRKDDIRSSPYSALLETASLAACLCGNATVCPQMRTVVAPALNVSRLMRRERALGDLANVFNTEFDWSSTYSAQAVEWTHHYYPRIPMRIPKRDELRKKDQAAAVEVYHQILSTNPFSWANDVTPEDAYATRAGRTMFGSNGRMYDIQLLWTLTSELPVQALITEVLERSLRMSSWADTHDDPLIPEVVMDVMRNKRPEPREYIHHIQKIYNADLSYPILVVKQATGWLVADGLHRLAKVILSGGFVVSVRIVPDEILQQAVVSE